MKSQNNNSSVDLAEIMKSSESKQKSTKRIYWVIGAIILGIALWYFFGMQSSSDQRGPNFTTQEIKRGEIRLTVTATGNLEPTNEVSVGSELSGKTVEVFVDTNDRVKKGQALARLDTSTLENEMKSSRASLEIAYASLNQSEATLAEAEASLERQRELQKISEGRLPSSADMVSTEAAVARARADVLSSQASISKAKAEVDTRESDLSKATIQSPTDGVVLSRSIEVGQTVAASFSTPELFVIAEDLSQMKLEVSIAEADIAQVAENQKASFAVDAYPSRNFDASVLKVSYGSEVTDNVVTYTTELSVDNDDLSLRPGMTATADIDVAYHENVLLVPSAALRFTPELPEGSGPPKSGGAPEGDRPKRGENPESGGKSFLDSLLPRLTRPQAGKGNGGGKAEKFDSDESVVWILDEGRPRSIQVAIGLNDGRYIEVISEELEEGILVIIGEKRAVK